MKSVTEKSAKTAARVNRGGRPPRAAAGRIEAHLLDTARDLFFEQGYGATSIETLAREARISKRTFYHRFKDKPEIFRAVVRRVIDNIRPADTKALFGQGGDLEDILHRMGEAMLRVTLSKHLIALHRLLLAEAARFPELVSVVYQEGARDEAIERIGALLKRQAKTRGVTLEDAGFAAEQFIMLIIGVPQRRALGLGKPMPERELKDWVRRATTLFLNGLWNGKKPA